MARRRSDDAKTRPDEHARPGRRRAGSVHRPREVRRDVGRDTTLVYGFHAVLAALNARRRTLTAIHATLAAAARLEREIAAAGLTATIATSDEIALRLPPGAVHQGVLLVAGPLESVDLGDIEDRGGIVLVLDQITDPHNVGAILRTAAAFAVDAIVTTARHSPDLSGLVAKIASGGLDHVPVVEVVNLARAMHELGTMGYWRVGLDSGGDVAFAEAPVRRPLALVLGAEDKGLRRLTREACDAVARLDMPGPIKSLNVSNACAVALTLARQKVPPA